MFRTQAQEIHKLLEKAVEGINGMAGQILHLNAKVRSAMLTNVVDANKCQRLECFGFRVCVLTSMQHIPTRRSASKHDCNKEDSVG